jgi:uncharacterized protein (DUF697 family)
MNFGFNLDRVLDPLLKTKRERGEVAVRNQVLWAMGAGLVPVPILDVAAVTAVQVNLVQQLCGIYARDYDENKGRAIVSALISSLSASLGASMFKAIPVIGTYIGGASMAVLSGGATYAVGQVFMRHFEQGGTLDTFDLATARKLFEEELERGKEVARKMYESGEFRQPGSAGDAPVKPAQAPVADDAFAKIEKLAALRDKGLISEEEYLTKKQQLLNSL